MKGYRYPALMLICFILFPALLHAEEKIVEVRFMGNFTIPDETMMSMGGIVVGASASSDAMEDIRQRLLETRRFESVEVTRRYRSIGSGGDVVLLITVREKQPVAHKFMFLPILSGSDEYGFSYGIRTTAKDLLGLGERLSVPATWGGIRQAALEGEFGLNNPVAQTLTTRVGVSQKENPFYDTGDFRKEIRAAVTRRFDRFEIGAETGWTDVDFGSEQDDFAVFGANFVLDTRQDINLPRDAVYTGIGWERLSFLRGRPGINVYTLDLRGYKGLFGQTVLAAQVFYSTADAPLPAFERPFLGGANTLRGWKPGSFIGDSIATASLELRIPLSPLRTAYHTGIDFFVDTGAVYDHGRALWDARFRQGVGAGGYFLIAGFGIKVDVAYNMRDSFRVHFSTGFRF